jgi:hypothetical protein
MPLLSAEFVAVVFMPPLQEVAMTELVPLIFGTVGYYSLLIFFGA